MGMDAYIFRARTKKAFEEKHWYESEEITEVWYTRKFWDLINNLSFIKNIDECACDFIQLTKADLEEMIDISCHNPDYFGEFTSVPALCKILYNFDTDEENGWHYYLEYDY